MSVDDYSWWRTWRPAWAEAHCVTLVGDATVEGVVESLRAHPVTRAHGFDAFYDYVVADWPDGYDPSRAVVGVATVDDTWTLVAEVNGYVGVTERLIGPLSSGRTVVSHFANVNAVHTFHWWHDGQLLVDVDLMFPAERDGTDPDVLVDHVRGVGIPLDADPEEIATVDLSAAGFALAQRVTGIACTPELFERTDFLVATVAS
ncbi:hypothetical protein H7J06_19300 [Mycobacterium hodleri]|uniref:DUF6461 domain-containing protein n=1 Tax=Mycolicibacterium hodleri TaxID=49897 RepID=UPI0021F3B63A|nr:DUF6461 domain-containing protein [Mycolicibacterium hodleri]MCV7135131.1 hypothetical protein [Mycolicibacterium hodleri]